LRASLHLRHPTHAQWRAFIFGRSRIGRWPLSDEKNNIFDQLWQFSSYENYKISFLKKQKFIKPKKNSKQK